MVEGAPLLREYTVTPYRGFESLPLRHFLVKICCISMGYEELERGYPSLYPPLFFETWIETDLSEQVLQGLGLD